MWVSSVSDRYIIQWLSHDTAKVGIYAAAYGLISQPFIILQVVVTLTLRPIYFAAVAAGNAAHGRRTLSIWLAIVTVVGALGVMLVFALRYWLASKFLGQQYRQASAPLPWIALGYLFYDVAQVLEQWLLARKRTELLLVSEGVGAIASIAVTIPLVIKYGMMGAAYACPCYFFIQALATAILVLAPGRPGVEPVPSPTGKISEEKVGTV